MKRQHELSLIPTLHSDLMHEISREILDYKTLMSWHGCCRSYWLRHVAVDHAQWLKELEERSHRIVELSKGWSIIGRCRDHAMMQYAIKVTKLCQVIEEVIPRIPSMLPWDKRLPGFAYGLNEHFELKDFVLIKDKFEHDGIIILKQAHTFIRQRYNWLLFPDDEKKIYTFPMERGTIVNSKKLHLTLYVN
jgi:hypothetical protein